MKNLFLMFISIGILFSCNENELSIEEKIKQTRNSNFEIFNGITIEARNELDGIYKVPFLSIERNGKEYLLPNFSYYGCDSSDIDCLENKTRKSFDVIEFNNDINTDNNIDPYVFSYNYTLPIFNEFEKLRNYLIISNSRIGDCIIFNLDENNYLAYVPDINNVKNEVWKSRFVEDNKIDDMWFFGTR